MREVSVYVDLSGINLKKWHGLQTLIKVEREVVPLFSSKNITVEIAYFISSLPADTPAFVFNRGIRNHWLIENSLHYVKDKTFGEDASGIRTKQAPENLSLLRDVAINVFRTNGFTNMAKAIRLISHDIARMRQLLRG